MQRALIVIALFGLIAAGYRLGHRGANTPLPVPAPAPPVRVSVAQPPPPPGVSEISALEPASHPPAIHLPTIAPRPQPAVPPTIQTQQVIAVKSPKKGKPPIKDRVARAALHDVGVDADAEEYWVLAINDPALSGSERSDLIEDLNEEGFADPKNLTIEDLPLIVSRIEVIETYAPFAMDDVNADAFAEAYKDLWNMLARVTGH